MQIRPLHTFAVVIAASALLVTGCGGGDDVAGNGTDRAFAADMIPHHVSAVRMAEIAQQRGTSAFVKRLAADVVRTQTAEIATLRAEDAELADAGVKRGDLGVDNAEMGMDMDTGALETSTPFDAAFLRMMLPHHEGAIVMAKVEVAKGQDPELKRVAEQVIAAQNREIQQMRARLGA